MTTNIAWEQEPPPQRTAFIVRYCEGGLCRLNEDGHLACNSDVHDPTQFDSFADAEIAIDRLQGSDFDNNPDNYTIEEITIG